ncbi:hypothetical protein IYY11_21350 [Methylocystis sp. H62]|uniref:hypothetical protein n=1 Tax=Methylocystis sp. H62 TaxID=2785789 RepID=UPI0018C23657|nr:hypothetical protein [Methylocystis sp. H62]MBG0795908.1 hypothetical protein [Methylocystis sp. H62]
MAEVERDGSCRADSALEAWSISGQRTVLDKSARAGEKIAALGELSIDNCRREFRKIAWSRCGDC